MQPKSRRATTFQVLKLVFLGLLAISLVKIAFFPNQEDTTDIAGTGNFITPTVVASKGTIDNTLELTGTIVRNEPTTVKATAGGEIVWVYANSGDYVGYGQPILQVKRVSYVDSAGQTVSDPAAAGDDASITVQTAYANITATNSGTINWDIVPGQQIEVGQPVGSISPASFHAVASIKPSQLYAIGENPQSAKVEIKDGPAPFLCDAVKVESGSGAPTASGSGSTESTSNTPSTGSASPQIRCDIPADQTVFDGLPAVIKIGGQTNEDVLTVPVTAVEGRYREGIVYVPNPDDPQAAPRKQKVQLGVTDGMYIEIKGGLQEGDEVLQFVPVRKNQPGTGGPDDGVANDADLPNDGEN